MNSQWHSHERWGTMGFVPLTIFSLLCSFHTWSCHKPAVPAAVALPQTSLLGNWHSLVWHCRGAASLSPRSKKSPAWLWLPAKWLFFLCGYTENSLLQGLSHTPDVLQGPVSMELSCNTPWCNLRVQWVMKWASTYRDPAPAGHSLFAMSSAAPALLHWSSCLDWEAECAACPILCLYLHLTQRPSVIYWSHISALLNKNFV